MLYFFSLFLFFTPFVFAQSYEQKNCAADTVLANQLFELGEKLRKVSKLDSAALCYEQAAEIWENACPEVSGEKRKRFWQEYLKNKNRRGFLFYLQGEINSSTIKYLWSALQHALQRLGENSVNEEISYIHSNLGIFYSFQKRYTEALTHFQKALGIQLTIWGEKSPRVATLYNNIANAYEEQARYEDALQYHQKALSTRITVYGENHIHVGTSYNNIANVYWQQGRYQEALEYHQKALAIRIAVYGENHPETAMSYNNIHAVYKKQKRYAEALEHQQKAMAIWLNVYGQNHANMALSYNNISELYHRQNNYAEALAYCQKALESNAPNWKPSKKFELPQSSSILNTDYLLNTLIVLSQTLFSVGISSKTTAGRDSALSYALKATHYGIGQLNGWRQTMRRETDQIELGKQATRLLSTGIACAFLMDSLGFQEQAPLKEAFFFSESNKAAALNLAMQESEALVAAGIPESLNALQQDYKRELTLCNQQLEAMPIPKTKEDTIKKQYYENRRFTYAAKLDSLIHVLEKEYPKYYELKYATFIASVDTLQKTLSTRSPNTAIIEYFVSDTAFFVFAMNAKAFAAKKILLPQKELKKLMNQLGRSYYALTENDRQDPAKKQNYINAAVKLYQKLIAPVEEIIKNKELVIIPDGLLWELPFEVLIKAPAQAKNKKLEKLAFEKLPLLNQFHSVRYSPNATAFFRSFSLPSPKGQGLFAVAPVFDAQEERVLASRAASNRDVVYPELVAPLPGSESEVEELKKLFQKQNLPAKLLLREQAKEEVFTGSPLASFRYIHLATHGVFNRNKPSWSYLLFSRPADTAANLERDGLLTAAECYNLKLDAELVALSACETGRGELKPGEGLVGLTRGLLYSGARAVLVSQWKVPDQATSKLMQVFYQNLLSGMSKSKALQAAKETMRKSGFAHPYYWAAFVLVGR